MRKIGEDLSLRTKEEGEEIFCDVGLERGYFLPPRRRDDSFYVIYRCGGLSGIIHEGLRTNLTWLHGAFLIVRA